MHIKKYLNEDDIFITGEFEGESLEDVAFDVPGFLEFLLTQDNLGYYEREKIEKMLEVVRDR